MRPETPRTQELAQWLRTLADDEYQGWPQDQADLHEAADLLSRPADPPAADLREALKVITTRREQHTEALRGWTEPTGFLLPTEPDPDERRRIRDCLHAALAELSLVEHALLRGATGAKP
jgi:hypothetical protein